MTIADLTVTGTPAIFVPYPFAAQDHQTSNALYVQSKGAAIVIPQAELNRIRLSDTVRSLLTDKLKLKEMRKAMAALGKPNAAQDIARQLKELSRKD
jgi:UDP-N-acetylglucosamine--N-acetylmuramyl-(pentapeptide) pyrophosphoryl-undecaprenol N-acetylglucosamine transferase